MDTGSQAMHCHEASWERLLAHAFPSCHCEERFCDEAISLSSAVKDEIASPLRSFP